MECVPRNGTHCKTKEEVETNQLGILIETPIDLAPPHDSGSRSARVKETLHECDEKTTTKSK